MNTVNFNRHRPPILKVPLLDADETVLHVTLPTVALQEELRAYAGDFHALLDGGNEDTKVAIWELVAKLMSCNRNWLKVTPEQLRKTYNLDEEDLIVFLHQYVDFVNGTENAKN